MTSDPSSAAAPAAARKEDHIRLAAEQRSAPASRNDFDDLQFVHHALDGRDIDEVDLSVRVGDWTWPVPIYINGMTGGAETAGRVNRALGAAARETGLPMASGSLGIALADPDAAASFRVIREENPDGFVMANIGAGRSPEDAQSAVDLLGADALQLHLNAVQETIMPEGSRDFSGWLRGAERIVAATSVPVVVKEVGFGLSSRTLAQLADIGVTVADVSGTGGTNFARIESARGHGELAYLHDFGQSAVCCLLDAPASAPRLLASGGVRSPMDAVKALALGARAVGIAGPFLKLALDGGTEALVDTMRSWLGEISLLLALLGARTPADLRTTDLLVRGDVAEFAALRRIDTTALARRSDSRGLRPAGEASADNQEER